MENVVFQGSAQIAKNPMPPTMWSYNDAVEDDAYDPEGAKAILEAEGAAGLKMKIWAMPVQRPYNPNARRMAELMQADFEANRGTAQDQAGLKSPRPSSRGRQPQRPTSPCGKKPPLNPGRKGIRGGVAETRKNPQQERPGAGSSQGRSVPEREPSDRTRSPDLPQGTPGE